MGGGGWGKAENKAKLSPAGAGSWAELGNKLSPAGAGSWAELGNNLLLDVIPLWCGVGQEPYKSLDPSVHPQQNVLALTGLNQLILHLLRICIKLDLTMHQLYSLQQHNWSKHAVLMLHNLPLNPEPTSHPMLFVLAWVHSAFMPCGIRCSASVFLSFKSSTSECQ